MASKLPPGNGARSSGGSGGDNRPYYDEYELDRKVRKRRARLVSAAEDAFTHIKRIRKDQLGESGLERGFCVGRGVCDIMKILGHIQGGPSAWGEK